jgi:hypothetical protein
MNSEAIREELIRRQGDRSGREFARLLGISESYWSLIRRGQRPITPSLLERARQEFPDLLPPMVAEVGSPSSPAALTPTGRPRPIWGLKHFRLLVNSGLAALIIGAVALSQVLSGDGPSGTTFAAESHRGTPTNKPSDGGGGSSSQSIPSHHGTLEPTKRPAATKTPTPKPGTPTSTKTPAPSATPFVCPSGFTAVPGHHSRCVKI